MLKGNLATRPFYNEQLVNLLIAALAGGAILLAIFNTTRTIYLSGERERRTVVERESEETIRTLTEAANRQKNTVDVGALNRLGVSTAEANDIIDRRMFSWTVLLSLLEETIPMDVRLVSIGNRLDATGFNLTIDANAKRTSDLEQFVDRLRGTGYFFDVFPSAFQVLDDGSYSSVIESRYQAPAITGPKETPAKDGGRQP
jgi:hypothetical protein